MRDDKYVYRTVTFGVHAPEAQNVAIAGTFNDWDVSAHPMKRCGRGKDAGDHWQILLRLLPGTYEYLFYVDGQWWNDPASNQYMTNAFESLNNVMEVH